MNIQELKEKINKKENELNKLKEELKNFAEYESIMILNPKTTIEDLSELKKELEKIVGDFEKYEELGIKQLAYPIQNQNKGFYIDIEFTGTYSTVSDLEKYYRKNENIMKFVTIKKEDF